MGCSEVYDLDRNLAHVELPDGRMVYSVSYVRDAGGRITQRIEMISGVTTTYDYAYDGFGRLDQVRENAILVADYAYDDNGNRSSVTRPGRTVSGTYDAQDRILSDGTHTYAHNANGDLVSRTDTATSATTTFLYDEMGALLQATLPDGRVVDYLIDARNRRIGKRVDGILERAWLYDDQLRPGAELDGAGNVVSVFVYADGPAGGAPDYMVRGGVTYRFLTDHVGSPRLVVDAATGAIAQRVDFDEYGRVLADSNPGWQPFGFAGGLRIGARHCRTGGTGGHDPALRLALSTVGATDG